jgi:hypothetical protein
MLSKRLLCAAASLPPNHGRQLGVPSYFPACDLSPPPCASGSGPALKCEHESRLMQFIFLLNFYCSSVGFPYVNYPSFSQPERPKPALAAPSLNPLVNTNDTSLFTLVALICSLFSTKSGWPILPMQYGPHTDASIAKYLNFHGRDTIQAAGKTFSMPRTRSWIRLNGRDF